MKISKVINAILLAGALILALYIMINGLGLADGLDFGAGAYYYADIPEFAKYVNGEHFKAAFPIWFYIWLFFLWGGLMFKLWVWLDKKIKN